MKATNAYLTGSPQIRIRPRAGCSRLQCRSHSSTENPYKAGAGVPPPKILDYSPLIQWFSHHDTGAVLFQR